jgi:hypothetical protein
MVKIKTLITTLLLVALFFVYANPVNVLADNPAANAIGQGACDAAGQANCTDKQSATSVNTTVTNVINILSVAVGLVAVIMIIVAGLRYISSGGAQDKVAAAKNTILYAVIGLVIVALAQVIVHFVIQKTK